MCLGSVFGWKESRWRRADGGNHGGAVVSVAASKQESSGLDSVCVSCVSTPLITITSSQQRAVCLTQEDL